MFVIGVDAKGAEPPRDAHGLLEASRPPFIGNGKAFRFASGRFIEQVERAIAPPTVGLHQ